MAGGKMCFISIRMMDVWWNDGIEQERFYWISLRNNDIKFTNFIGFLSPLNRWYLNQMHVV